MSTDISRRILYFTISGWAAASASTTMIPETVVVSGNRVTAEISSNTLVLPDFDNTGAIVRLIRNSGPRVEGGLWILRGIETVGSVSTITADYYFGSDVTPDDGGTWGFYLEDPYKISSTIPEWVTGPEAIRRWAPVLTNTNITLGQKINLKGGIASVDGITLSGVYDENYQGFTDNGRYWPLLAKLFARSARPNTFGEFSNLIVENIDGQDRITNPLREDTFPVFYPIPDLITEAGKEQGPIFIDNEAMIVFASEETDPPSAFTNIFGHRSWNETDNSKHGKSSIIYDELPFAIGSICNVWTILDSNAIAVERTYRGLVENITIGNGLTSFGIQISSLLYTPNVALRRSRGADQLFRAVEIEVDDRAYLIRDQTNSREYRLRDIGSSDGDGRRPVIPRAESVDTDGDSRVNSAAIFTRAFIAFQNQPEAYQWVKMGPFLTRVHLTFLLSNISRLEQNLGGFSNADVNVYHIPCDAYPDDESLQFNGKAYSSVGWISPNRGITTIVSGVDRVITGVSPFFPRIIRDLTTGELEDFPVIPNDVQPVWYLVEQLSDNSKAYVERYKAITLDRRMTFLNPNERRQRIASELAALFRDAEIALAHMFTPSGALTNGLGNDFSTPTAANPNQFVCVHPADVLLQVLTSTGHGFNGPYDVAPSVFGLGIEAEMIDVDSFVDFARRNPDLRMVNAHMVSETNLDPSKFIVENILKPFFLCLAQRTNGSITLIDLNDTRFRPDTDAFSNDVFARSYDNGLTTVVADVKISSEDLVDSVSYKLRTFFARSITSAAFNRNITIQGLLANIDSTLGVQTAQTRVFTKIQTSPLVFEPKNSTFSTLVDVTDSTGTSDSAADTALISRANDYLKNYRKIVAKFTFEGILNRDNPLDIGENLLLDVSALPDAEGRLNGQAAIAKIIDAKVNYDRDLVTYVALVYDTAINSRAVYWNLTANVVSVDGDDITVSEDDYTQFGIGGENGEFEKDYDQFFEGDVVRVFSKSFEDKTLTPGIVAKTDAVWTLTDATGIVAGDIIMLSEKDTSLSAYAGFLVWFDDVTTPLA